MNAESQENVGKFSAVTMTRLFSFFILLAIVGVLFALSYQVMHNFVLPLFLAALLVVIFEPIHVWLRRRCQGRTKLAAGLTTAAILFIVLVPLAWTVTMGVREGIELAARLGDGNRDIQLKLRDFRQSVGLDIPWSGELREIEDRLAGLRISDTAEAVEFTEDEMRSKLDALRELDADLTDFKQQLSVERNAENVSRSRKRRIDGSLAALNQLVQAVRDFSEAVAGEDTTDDDATADPPEVTPLETQQYQNHLDRAVDLYRLTRQAMMGGVMWGYLTQLANPSEEQIVTWKQRIMDVLRGWMVKLTGQTTSLMGSLLMQFFILTIAIFYFLIDGPEMVKAAMELSPMDDQYEEEMITEFSKLSRAVVLATLLSAIAQGMLAGFGYFAVWGGESLFVLIILTTVCAMVPFVGAAAIWVPVCVYLAFVEDRTGAAIGLGLYGFFVISMADNVIKPLVLRGQSNLHPLFALLSVIGGVQALGPIGVLVGPMIVAFLQSLLNILHKDLRRLDKREPA